MQRLRIVVALTLSACGPSANHGNASTTPSASADDATCQQEVTTGTNFDKKVCRSESQKEAERKAARDLYLDPQYRPGRR